MSGLEKQWNDNIHCEDEHQAEHGHQHAENKRNVSEGAQIEQWMFDALLTNYKNPQRNNTDDSGNGSVESRATKCCGNTIKDSDKADSDQ